MIEVEVGRMMAIGVAASTQFCGHSPDRFVKLEAYLTWLQESVEQSPANFFRLS